MSRVPTPSLSDAVIEAVAILGRRIEHGDRDLDRRGFPDTNDLFGVLTYVHTCRQVPASVLDADCLSVLVITRYLERELDRRKLLALNTVRSHQMPWSAIARAAGVKSKQGAEQMWQRLRNAYQPGGGRRSEVDARHHQVEDMDRAELPPARNLELLLRTAQRLVALRRLMPDDLRENADVLRDAATPAATLGHVRELLDDLARVPDLDAQLRQVVEEAAPLLVE